MGNATLRSLAWGPVLCACWIATAALPSMRANAQQQASPEDSGSSDIVRLEHRSASEMSPEDSSLVDKRQREIAREAEFFGYELAAHDWTHDQVVCPDMPNDLILHYRSRSRTGAESLFTAVVPRGAGRVMVVPVLFRNAIPFHAATGSERSLTVFNQAVPKEVAQKAAEPDGPWLMLGMCYAAVAGAEPQVPQRTDTETSLVHAPVPTIRIAGDHQSREIIFSDRNDPRQYMVWSITLTDHGRLTAASARTFADYKAQQVSNRNPPEKVIESGSQPKKRVIPPGPQPKEKVIPPGKQPDETRVPQ